MTWDHAGQLVTGAGAVLAAIFAGLTLWQSKRHEQTRWTRAALESTFVDFVTAWYDSVNACKQIAMIHVGLVSHKSEAEWLQESRHADAVMMKAITRLRVLSSDEVAELARDLNSRNEIELDLIARGCYDELLGDKRKARNAAYVAIRDRFIDEAQRRLSIG